MTDYGQVPCFIFGFGHRARSGKDTAVAEIVKQRGFPEGTKIPKFGMEVKDFAGLVSMYDVRRYAFADELKREFLENVFGIRDDFWKFLDEFRHPTISSFMRRVKVSDKGCWIWQGAYGDRGYGKVYTPERGNYRAHRFMWEKVLGNTPVELLRHTCDVRLCVNPLHLLPGTLQENSQDMVDRARFRHGENHPNSTLSDKEIQHVLDLYFYWDMTQDEISKAFNVSDATVSRLVTGNTRKPVPTPEPYAETVFSEQWLNDEHKYKFRVNLQQHGTEYRRDADPNYWVKRLADRLIADKPEVALITDMRFPNEMAFVQAYGDAIRVDRPGMKSPNAHISEEALAGVPDDKWDFILVNDGTVEEFRLRAVSMFDFLMNRTESKQRPTLV